jgi:hypothetical protein
MQRSDNYRLVTFTFGSKLRSQWGPRLRRLVHRGWAELPKYSPWLPSILLGSRVFLELRWMMLEKVLGVSAVRCWLYLVAQPSHIGVDVDRPSCPPTPSYCLWISSWSLEFLVQDYSSLLGRQTFLEGATDLAGPHVVTLRLGPRALGPAPPCLNHPSWDSIEFTPSLSGGERPLRWFTLHWWRRFESSSALSW